MLEETAAARHTRWNSARKRHHDALHKQVSIAITPLMAYNTSTNSKGRVAMKSIEKVITEVNGTMAIEGMPLTQEDRDRIRKYAGNNRLVDKAVSELVKKYSTDIAHEPRI